MGLKSFLLQTAFGSLVALVMSIGYHGLYTQALLVNFDSIIPLNAILISTIIGIILMNFGHYAAFKWLKGKGIVIIHLFYVGFSFLTLIAVFGVVSPGIERPELLPGYLVPLHLFPLIGFFAVIPFFKR